MSDPCAALEAMDHLERRGGGRKGGARLAAVAPFQKNPRGFGS